MLENNIVESELETRNEGDRRTPKLENDPTREVRKKKKKETAKQQGNVSDGEGKKRFQDCGFSVVGWWASVQTRAKRRGAREGRSKEAVGAKRKFPQVPILDRITFHPQKQPRMSE